MGSNVDPPVNIEGVVRRPRGPPIVTRNVYHQSVFTSGTSKNYFLLRYNKKKKEREKISIVEQDSGSYHTSPE